MLPSACRHLDGVGSSRDQAEPWLASGQNLIDRMEQSRAAGQSLLGM